jgi:hypothetical protein
MLIRVEYDPPAGWPSKEKPEEKSETNGNSIRVERLGDNHTEIPLDYSYCVNFEQDTHGTNGFLTILLRDFAKLFAFFQPALARIFTRKRNLQ